MRLAFWFISPHRSLDCRIDLQVAFRFEGREGQNLIVLLFVFFEYVFLDRYVFAGLFFIKFRNRVAMLFGAQVDEVESKLATSAESYLLIELFLSISTISL